MIGFLLLLLLLFILFYNYYWKRRHLPPGPAPLPGIGNLLDIFRAAPGYAAFCKWNKQYGGIYTYYLSELPVVAISDYDLIQETFVKDGDTFAGRYHFGEITEEFRGGCFGIVDTDGDLWREQRRFTLHVLRDFGVGRNVMEEKVLDEVSEVLRTIAASPEEASVEAAFDVGVGSIVCSLLFGYRYEGDKLEDFRSFKRMMVDHMRLAVHPLATLLIFKMNLFKHIPVFSGIYQQIMSNRDRMYGYFDSQIEEHEKRFKADPHAEPRDYVDSFLREMHKQKESNEPSMFTHQQLRNVILDLFIAGQETTTNTLTWTVLYILHHPEVQQKMHEELDNVIGNTDRLIKMADKPNLPYVNAVISESQRLTNLLPQNLFHRTVRDVVVKGYLIPKDTCIIPQISCVLYDEKIFPEPYEFRPERFLDDKKQLKRVEEFIPFSIGKRQCLGEGLARMELFLFVANLYNSFKLDPIDPSKPPSLEKRAGITVQPYHYTSRATKRFHSVPT